MSSIFFDTTRPFLKLFPWVMVSTLLLTGCIGGEESSDANQTASTAVTVNTPASIAQESADNYDDNVNGLITGKTLKRWMDDWEANRPAGITGKLVILQQTKGPAGFEFIKPDNTNVFTYWTKDEWREPRDNGVTEIAGIVISGSTVDLLLRKYGIDVKKDMIVCAQGTGGSAAMEQGRCWYTLRYWGMDKKNLAVLNGGNNHLTGTWAAADFTNTPYTDALPDQPSPIINRQVSSVKELPVDNTILHATLEDVINALPTRDENNTRDGYFLWDARSTIQYSAGEAQEVAAGSGGGYGGAVGNRYSSFQNNGSRQSHPRGALQLDWTNLISTSTGLYKTKAELRSYLEGNADAAGHGFIDGTYGLLGAGNAYQKGDTAILWCETSARAAVAQVVSAVILGVPTRLYDSAMIEWNSLTAIDDKNGDKVLPADSPWRTDVLSAPYFPNQAASINPRNAWSDPANPKATAAPRITNAYGVDAGKIVREDKAYKQPPTTNNGSGSGSGGNTGSGGVTLPSNPCGG